MPILPSIATLEDDLGGTLRNYSPVEDPTTDLDAKVDNNARCMAAMSSHTALRAWVNFVSAATTPGLLLNAHDSMWGNSLLVAPALSRLATGTYLITFPAVVYDELKAPYGPNAHTLSLRAAWAASRSNADARNVVAFVNAANQVTVYLRDVTGALVDGGDSLDVFIL